MLNSILWIATVTAGVAALAAYVMTGSLLWTFLAYSGSGMSVLFAILIAEMLIDDAPRTTLDESGLIPDQHG